MNKKYLIEEEKLKEFLYDIEVNGIKECAKEVEVLDDAQCSEVRLDYETSDIMLFPDYLKANKYLIVKIIE